MSLRKLTAGDGYSYLTRQVAAHDSTEKGHTSLADYYDEKGESPGRWMGSGLAGLVDDAGRSSDGHADEVPVRPRHAPQRRRHRGADRRAWRDPHRGRVGDSARQEVPGPQHFVRLQRPRRGGLHDVQPRAPTEVERPHPASRSERGSGPRSASGCSPRSTTERRRTHAKLSGFIAKASRQATSAVAGFDLTFSPVKSVSALWALAPRDVAGDIRAAHDAAVADTLSWLEREVAHTRVGRGGARQVKVRGLVAAAFTHRDSRAGDPDLHTHVAVSNKVQAEDGRWLALDGRLLYAAKVAASEHYNTRIEAELVGRLGVEFVERAGSTTGRLPVREIRGVSTTLTRWWSRRRVAIETRQAEIAAEFQQRFGRPPTAIEAKSLADQATLETRDAKHGHRSERDQRATWRAEADDVMGDPAEVDEMYAHAINRGNAGRALTREWVEDAAASTIVAVEESRATWNVWHLLAEAQRQARRSGIAREEVDRAVSEVVEAAISRSVRLGVDDPVAEPAQLRRPDGASVYDVHGATLYTSAKVLSAENELLALAARSGGHALADVRVEVAVAASAANGFELNDAQVAMVRDLATSGALVQLALAPAGTGKTTTMSVLADAWTEGGGQVIGLAPSAQAAHELGQAITGHTDTLAKLTWTLANESAAEWPRWIREIGPNSMVIIDEAGQAATTELTAAVRYVAERGGVVRLVGDDQQLAAVGAGGILRDIQQEFGASTLSEVRRFDDPAEAAATLAMREGDAGALGFYADGARIHVGDLGSVADQAYDAWAADRAAGLDAVLLAPTRDLVSQLNARARADRLSTTPIEDGLEVDLADGNRASAGDVIVTRRNSRRLVISRSNWVKNGDRWRVEQVLAGGSLVARHVELGRSVELPADYVAEHVQLGYATTVHGAQGMTADTAHLVATGEETRQTLYVGVSRGRQANHIYLATGFDGDPHSLIDPKALRPPTAIDVLAEILERDGSDRSATTTQREAASCATQLHDAVMRYHDALGFAAEEELGVDSLASVDRDAEAIWPGLTAEPAYPTLRAHLALRALDGEDPVAALLDAAGTRELGTSNDRAAVSRLAPRRVPDRGTTPMVRPVPAPVGRAADVGAVPSRPRRPDHRSRCVGARGSRSLGVGRRSGVGVRAHRGRGRHASRRSLGLASRLRRARGRRSSDRPSAVGIVDDSVPAGPGPPGKGGARCSPRRREPDRTPADGVRSDAEFARLSERLGALQAAGIDVGSLVDRAVNVDHPLPDERAADALWWRIVRHLGTRRPPCVGRASPTRSSRPGRRTCVKRLGETVGERVMADAMWPALVAAVHARPAEWTPEQLLEAATSGRGPEVRPEDLCSALVWRIATMTDAPFDEPEPFEPDFAPVEPTPSEPVQRLVGQSTPAARIVELNSGHLTDGAKQYWRGRGSSPHRDRHLLHSQQKASACRGLAPSRRTISFGGIDIRTNPNMRAAPWRQRGRPHPPPRGSRPRARQSLRRENSRELSRRPTPRRAQ